MKNRLQLLWDEVTPYGGSCPQPNAEKIRRRVDAALDGRPRAVSRRTLRLTVMAVAAVLLLAGTAFAVGELILPEFNVLSANFFWGENPDDAIAMMSITPVSVEDDDYAMTVTSSLADGNKLYFTLIVAPKTDTARERLRDARVADLLLYRVPGSNARTTHFYYDDKADALLIDVSVTWSSVKNVAVRFDLMDGGIWLSFPVKTVRSITLKVNAEAQGVGGMRTSAAPVTVDRVEISPLSYMLRYTAPDLDIYPVVYFLFRDGSIRTASQLNVSGPTGGSSYGFFDKHPGRFQYSWKFGSVQDLSLMEAIVLGGMAYPLDGSESYTVDVSAIPRPFVIPIGEMFPIGDRTSGDWSVPLFALCDGLDVDYRWDGAAGVAVATFRDVTLAFTVGSKTVQVDGSTSLDTFEGNAAPAYRDGELWVDGRNLFRTMWSVNLNTAVENWEKPQIAEDGSAIFTSWIVNP